jgi:DNA repair exonuclease SbcCD nuclease subunit
MKKPYVIVSDLHCHNWSAFAQPTEDGINSRLFGILNEVDRAAKTVRAAGGDTMIVAGDLFHVRGQISPSVLNPVLDLFGHICKIERMHVLIIPGNHDLEGKNSERLGSAVTALESVGCYVVNGPWLIDDKRVLVPWYDKIGDLKQAILDARAACVSNHADYDLIIHAPIDGVIRGIPDHGLSPEWLRDLGFQRVFSGHYHNHREFFGGKVFSIGAIAHHTWSDVGSQAGFIVAHNTQTDFHPSELPMFVDVVQGTPIEEIAKQAKGNYLRVKVNTTKVAEIEKLREWLVQQGALGVSIISVKKPVDERTGSVADAVRAGASMEQSVSEFIKGAGFENAAEVQLRAAQVLAEVAVV